MGIGYTVIVNKEDVSKALDILKEQDIAAYQIGEIVKSNDAPIYLEGIDMTKVAIFASGSEVTSKILYLKLIRGTLII